MWASAREEHRRVTGIGKRHGKLSRELVQPDRVKFCLRGSSCRLLVPLDDMDKAGLVDCNLEQMDRFDGRILLDGDYSHLSSTTVVDEHDASHAAFEAYRDILVPIISGRSAEEVLLHIPLADGIEEEERGAPKKTLLKPIKVEATAAIPYNYDGKSASIPSKTPTPALQVESIDSYDLYKDLVDQYEDLPSKLREKLGLIAKLFGVSDLQSMVLAELDDDESGVQDAVPKPVRKRGVYDPDALPSYAVRRSSEPMPDPRLPLSAHTETPLAPKAVAQKKPLTPMEKLRLKTQQALERTQRPTRISSDRSSSNQQWRLDPRHRVKRHKGAGPGHRADIARGLLGLGLRIIAAQDELHHHGRDHGRIHVRGLDQGAQTSRSITAADKIKPAMPNAYIIGGGGGSDG